MRTLSLNMRDALFSQESGEVLIFLLTIDHETLDVPFRLSTDRTTRVSTDPLTYKTASRGNDYIYAGVGITMPEEQDKSPPSAKLVIENVTRDLVPLARSISTPATCTIEAVLASDLDTVEISWPSMDMSNLTWDASTLTFDLTIDALATEPYPAGTFSPASFGALFF